MLKEEIKKELYVLGVIFFTLVIAWNVYDYKNSIVSSVRPDALAATGTHIASLSVTVAQSITLTQTTGSSVLFGTLTPGTKVTGATGLTITTNGTGMNITAGRQRAITSVTLASNAAPTLATNEICDAKTGCPSGTIAGNMPVFTGLLSPCASGVWAAGTSLGLGFTNYAFRGGSAKNATCWGTGTTVTDANNKYSALQASVGASSFISSSGYTSGNVNVSVGYALDVSSSQKATSYNGGVVFTATSSL